MARLIACDRKKQAPMFV